MEVQPSGMRNAYYNQPDGDLWGLQSLNSVKYHCARLYQESLAVCFYRDHVTYALRVNLD